MKIEKVNVDYNPEKDILMLFAEQPDDDPYKYFIEGLTQEDLKTLLFKSVYCFHTPEEFLEVWKKKTDGSGDDEPDSMWYWVVYKGECICSGACDPNDIDIFEEYFEMEGKGE